MPPFYFNVLVFWLLSISFADWKDSDGVIYSSKNPKDGYYPNIGNGFIASNVGCYKDLDILTNPIISATPCGNIFMSGVYNGNLSNYNPLTKHYRNTTNRARIPGIYSYYIDTLNSLKSGYNITWLGATIDLQNGTVNNRSIIQHPTKCATGAQVQITSYMHRSIRSLMVFNISLIDFDGKECEIILNHCNLNDTNDFNWKQWTIQNNSKHIILRQMTIKIAENINSTLTNVGMAYQSVPINLILSNNNPTISFYGVLHNSLALDTNISDAMELTTYCQNELMTYINSYTPSEIFSMHTNAMQSIWNSRIEFIGNTTITKGIYASYYYLINAIRTDYDFSISPGGIVSNAYEGHMFWDAETWMFPTLSLVYPSVAAAMLKYRLDRIYGAQKFAKENYNLFVGKAVQYPWEDAFSGDPVCVIPEFDHQEQHITADISRAVEIFYHSTKNISWYFDSKSIAPTMNSIEDSIEYNYWNLNNQTCNFWSNRFQKVIINESYYYYTIFNVVPPDESAGVVNSSIYTNVAAALTLKFCLNISETFINKTYVQKNIALLWYDILNNLYLPMSNKLPDSNGELLHLEYESYNGQDVNQADVALVQYPLEYFDDNIFIINKNNMKEILMNDLIYYQRKTTEGNTAGFFTGDSSYSIAWLRLLNVSMAQTFFNAAFSHMDINHFYIFVEKLKQDGGHLNFLTGIGGLLQNTLFGYGGAHLTDNYLYFNPFLPLLSQSNITNIIYHGLIYKGIPFKFKFTQHIMSFELKTTKSLIFDEYFIVNESGLVLYVDTLIPNYNTNTLEINKTYTLTQISPQLTVQRSICRVYTT
eukprot:502591_1